MIHFDDNCQKGYIVGNGKMMHYNRKGVIVKSPRIKPVYSEEVKKLLKKNPEVKLIKEAAMWLGYKKVKLKQYDFIVRKILPIKKKAKE